MQTQIIHNSALNLVTVREMYYIGSLTLHIVQVFKFVRWCEESASQSVSQSVLAAYVIEY
jgi:hypothetical protein